MSIWTRIADALSALAAGEGLFAVFDRLRSTPENSVGFTIAVIALGAKMAKADGTVTRDEVTAFRRVFTIPEDEEDHAAHVFNLARQDVAGFDAYARKIRRMFRDENHPLLADLVETLFHIAMADGRYHDLENDFLDHVAEIFGLTEAEFSAIRARYVEGAPHDPFTVLGLTEAAGLEDARAAWKQAVRDNHPDLMIARGLPPEAISLAERRLIAINSAWEQIQQRRAA